MPAFDHAILLGRFAPPTAAGIDLVRRALKAAVHVIVILDGDRQARTLRHPFDVAERAAMIHAALGDDAVRVSVRGVREFLYDEARALAAVQSVVRGITGDAAARRRGAIAVVVPRGAKPADVRFPQWSTLPLAGADRIDDAGTLREAHDLFFGSTAPLTRGARAKLAAHLPSAVLGWLDGFRGTSGFAGLAADHDYIRRHRAKFAMLEFPPVFTTVDTVVVHSGHILLIERGGDHGAGLWALPGGFLDQNERLVDACFRELREETRIGVPDAMLRAALRGSAVFDAPSRSLRGRTITHAFHLEFAGGPLPVVRGADDAKRARWVPLAAFGAMEPVMFDDHFQIAEHFLGAT